MTQPGYQQGAERAWWWKVAQHLDDTVLAATNATAHNLDDPTLVLAFQETVRQAQAILFEIFRAKGLLPSAPGLPNGTHGQSNGSPPPGMHGGPPPGMHMPPMPAPPMTGPAVTEEAMAAGGIPFSMGSAFSPPPGPPGSMASAFAPPPPPPGWPDMSAPPPPPPGWPDMSAPPSAPNPEAPAAAAPVEVVEVVEAEAAGEASPPTEGLEYGDDVGKGFENQEPEPAPEAKA